jgi:hypothetical protein
MMAFSRFSLIWGGEVNAAAILRATVIALAVQGGGVVNDKEISSKVRVLMTCGSYTNLTTSLCPVVPEQTCS